MNRAMRNENSWTEAVCGIFCAPQGAWTAREAELGNEAKKNAAQIGLNGFELLALAEFGHRLKGWEGSLKFP